MYIRAAKIKDENLETHKEKFIPASIRCVVR